MAALQLQVPGEGEGGQGGAVQRDVLVNGHLACLVEAEQLLLQPGAGPHLLQAEIQQQGQQK